MEKSVEVLKHLIMSLEKAEVKLEQMYDEKDVEKFNNLKKLMLQICEKIGGDE